MATVGGWLLDPALQSNWMIEEELIGAVRAVHSGAKGGKVETVARDHGSWYCGIKTALRYIKTSCRKTLQTVITVLQVAAYTVTYSQVENVH